MTLVFFPVLIHRRRYVKFGESKLGASRSGPHGKRTANEAGKLLIYNRPLPLPHFFLSSSLHQAGIRGVEIRMELVFAAPQPHHQPNPAVTRPNETPTPLTDLASALTHAAKLLSDSSPSSSAAAIASLRNAHQMIGSFIAQLDSRLPAGDEDEPMSDQREGEEEGDGGEGSRIVGEVEEGMRECVLHSKRRKRQVSPSWTLGRDADQGEELSSVHPMDRRRSSIDLVFQFHA